MRGGRNKPSPDARAMRDLPDYLRTQKSDVWQKPCGKAG
jgi:hypothetical protein